MEESGQTETNTEAQSPQSEIGPAPEQKESFFDFFRFAVIAVLIVVPIRFFIAQPFVVSGASMSPTFDTGNYLIVDELSYRFEKPKRGEVIVFHFPLDPKKFLIKRVIGLPNETVLIKNDTVTIKNEEHPEGFELPEGTILTSGRKASQEVHLLSDEYFVLGDNRDESADSRLWGPLKEQYIVGRPIFRLLPVSKMGIFPGAWNIR